MDGRALLVATLMASLFFAGCTGSNADDPDTTGRTPSLEGARDASLDGPESEAEEGLNTQTARFDLFFSDEETLDLQPPEAGTGIPLKGDLPALATGAENGVVVATTEFDSASLLMAEAIDVDLWLVADGPVVPSGVFDIGIYVGVDNGGMPFNALQAIGSPIQPDTPLNVQWTVPSADMWDVFLAPGDQVQALVISGMVTEGSNLRIMTGGEYASKMTLSLTWPLDDKAHAVAGTARDPYEGVVPRGGFGAGEQDGDSFIDHELILPANTTYLDLRVTNTGSQHADLDLEVLFAGSVIGAGRTPASSEHVRIAGPPGDNLKGQTVTVRVSFFAGVNGSYQVDVEHNE